MSQGATLNPGAGLMLSRPDCTDAQFGALLCEQFGDRLFDCITMLVADYDVSLRLVSEVLILGAQRTRFGGVPVGDWLYMSARETAFEWLAGKGRLAPDLRVVELEAPPATITEADQSAMVWTAMRALSERDQLIVILHLCHRVSNETLAIALDLTPEATEIILETTLVRVHERLAALLVLDYLVQYPTAPVPPEGEGILDILTTWDGHFTPLVHQKTVELIRANHLEPWRDLVIPNPLSLLAQRPLIPAPYHLANHVVERISSLALLSTMPPPPGSPQHEERVFDLAHDTWLPPSANRAPGGVGDGLPDGQPGDSLSGLPNRPSVSQALPLSSADELSHPIAAPSAVSAGVVGTVLDKPLDADSVFALDDNDQLQVVHTPADTGHFEQEDEDDEDDTLDIPVMTPEQVAALDIANGMAGERGANGSTTTTATATGGSSGAGATASGAGAIEGAGAPGEAGDGAASGPATTSASSSQASTAQASSASSSQAASPEESLRGPRRILRRRSSRIHYAQMIAAGIIAAIVIFSAIRLIGVWTQPTTHPTPIVQPTSNTPGILIAQDPKLSLSNSQGTTLVVANKGGTTLNWTVQRTPDWITLSATKGTLGPGETSEITLTKVASIKEGSSRDEIVLDWDGIKAGSLSVPVESTVINPPIVGVFISQGEVTSTCAPPMEVSVEAGDETGVALVEVRAMILGTKTEVSADLHDDGLATNTQVPTLPQDRPGASIGADVPKAHVWRGQLGPFSEPGTYAIEVVAQDTLGGAIRANRGSLTVNACDTPGK